MYLPSLLAWLTDNDHITDGAMQCNECHYKTDLDRQQSWVTPHKPITLLIMSMCVCVCVCMCVCVCVHVGIQTSSIREGWWYIGIKGDGGVKSKGTRLLIEQEK